MFPAVGPCQDQAALHGKIRNIVLHQSAAAQQRQALAGADGQRQPLPEGQRVEQQTARRIFAVQGVGIGGDGITAQGQLLRFRVLLPPVQRAADPVQPPGGLGLPDAVLQDPEAMAFLFFHCLQPAARCFAMGKGCLLREKAMHFLLAFSFLPGVGAQRRPVQLLPEFRQVCHSKAAVA